MNYYERHLGDYAKDTGHLSMTEHGAYTLLLDRYYSTEKPIPKEQAHRLCRARSKEEIKAVDDVLAEFFKLIDDSWVCPRAEREIVKKETKVKAAQENGRSGGRPKKRHMGYENVTQEKPTGFPMGYENVTQEKAHQSPVTSNQIPEGIPRGETVLVGKDASAVENLPPPKKTVAICMVLKTEGIASVNAGHPDLAALVAAGAEVGHFSDVARDCVARGKASFPYVLATVKGQMADAGKSAKAAGPKPIGNRQQPQSFARQDAIDGMLRWEQMTGSEHPDWHTVGGRPNLHTPDKAPVIDMGAAIEVQGSAMRIPA